MHFNSGILFFTHRNKQGVMKQKKKRNVKKTKTTTAHVDVEDSISIWSLWNQIRVWIHLNLIVIRIHILMLCMFCLYMCANLKTKQCWWIYFHVRLVRIYLFYLLFLDDKPEKKTIHQYPHDHSLENTWKATRIFVGFFFLQLSADHRVWKN